MPESLFETRNHVLRRAALLWIPFIVLFLTSALCKVRASPGDLDSTFGIGGKVTTDVGARETIRSIALQADWKIVAAGSSETSPFATENKFVVARYNKDGSLDST